MSIKLPKIVDTEPQEQIITKPLKFVHISDLNIDYKYKEGSISNCNDEICCRQTSSRGSTQMAGYWGSLANCDIPERTAKKTLKYIRDTIQPDIVFWTGDSSRSDDNQSDFE